MPIEGIKRITKPYLTTYEKTKIISIRAQQIASGGKVYLDYIPNPRPSPISLAKMELETRKTPIIIRRPLPEGDYEVWRMCDFM
jgi:DNA-directed RNA polymerase subunit K/omega